MPTMETYCAWCGKFLKLVECTPTQIHDVSHGICESCFQQSLKEIEEMRTQIAAPTTRAELKK